jgi:hypothetical protein
MVIRDHHQFSEVFFGLEQMQSLELEVLFLLIEDQGLYWVGSYDFCGSFNHTAPCQVRAIIWHFNM